MDRQGLVPIRKIVEPAYEVESRGISEEQLREMRELVEKRGGDWLKFEPQLRARGRDKFTVESARTYEPRIDVDIDPAEFEFIPPAGP